MPVAICHSKFSIVRAFFYALPFLLFFSVEIGI